MKDLHLCSIPFLDTTYTNVIDFENAENREEFFIKQTKKTVRTNFKYDNNRAFIVVNGNFEDLKIYDYLWYKNKNRAWFYFITHHEMITENNTRLYIELDVFTSYMFSYSFMPTFIDRMHVPRWNGDVPTYNIEDEGVSIGEYELLENPTKLYDLNKNIVVATSVPIGKTGYSYGNGGSDNSGGYGGTSWKDGKISSKGFRFLKGFEGFYPNKYQDSGGYWTIGYGTTLHGEPDVYNDLVSKQPITEEQASVAMYNSIYNSYSSKILNRCIELGITKQCQFDALVSVAYNCGIGRILNNNSLTNAIAENINDESKIREVWESFCVTSNGIYLEGLRLRRIEECNMFFGKEFEIRPIQGVEGDGWLPQDDSFINDDEGGSYNGHKTVDNTGGDGWLIPVKGATVTSLYGYRIHPISGTRKMHNGIDLGCSSGTPILAPKSGEVLDCGFHSSMGNYTKIKHSNGYTTIYMHQKEILVKKGDKVTRTQKIGTVGTTGDSTGNHLHWEFRNTDNETINPMPLAKKGDKV